MLDAYTLLGALAVRRDNQMKLGALVSPVTFRNPAVLAKTITTLDVLSCGRAVLGIGAGWDVAEHAVYDIPFPNAAERSGSASRRPSSCAGSCSPASGVRHAGRYYVVRDAWNVPQPVQAKIPLAHRRERPTADAPTRGKIRPSACRSPRRAACHSADVDNAPQPLRGDRARLRRDHEELGHFRAGGRRRALRAGRGAAPRWPPRSGPARSHLPVAGGAQGVGRCAAPQIRVTQRATGSRGLEVGRPRSGPSSSVRRARPSSPALRARPPRQRAPDREGRSIRR